MTSLPTSSRTRALAALLVAIVVSGCTGGAATSSTTPSGTTAAGTTAAGTTSVVGASTSTGTVTASAVTLAETHASADDATWDAADEIAVALRDSGTTAASGVTVSGSTVTITAAGTYRITGTISAGQLVVDTDDDGIVRLVLDGASIANPAGAALNVADADTVVIVLDAGSLNTLADGAIYTFPSADVTEPDAALFSTADLTITGTGALAVTANYADGIVSKDGLVIAGGTVTVTAKDDGVRGKDYLVVSGGTVTVNAGGDGLKSTEEDDATLGYVAVTGGTMAITAGTDGIDAFRTALVSGGTLTIDAGDDGIHSDARLEIRDGTITISRSYEGLEGTQIVITGGTTSIVAEDDGLNVAGGTSATGGSFTAQTAAFGGRGGMDAPVDGWFVEMAGGTLVISAGGDGFDSNGSASVTGGLLVVNGPTNAGNGALDVNGTFSISNATLVAAGSAGMVETPDSSAQAVLNILFNDVQQAGTTIRVQAADGTGVATFVTSKTVQSLVVSTPALVAGATYEVLTGGTVTGTNIGGLVLDATWSGGTSLGTLTAN